MLFIFIAYFLSKWKILLSWKCLKTIFKIVLVTLWHISHLRFKINVFQKMIPKRHPQKMIPKRHPQKMIPKRYPQKMIPKRHPQKMIPNRHPQKMIPKWHPQKMIPNRHPQKMIPNRHPQKMIPKRHPQSTTQKLKLYQTTFSEDFKLKWVNLQESIGNRAQITSKNSKSF